MKRNKAFTLIELVSVLVILAILALIVTPLVLNIIRKARTAADKRSIDAYGRSIELAIADYLLDNGTFPTSIEELTIEYSGDTVSCITTQLNPDSTIYLAECTVGIRTVEGYTYGKEQTVTYDVYSVGDEVTYNNVDYYVIKDSGATESTVTLLKAEPIKSSEIGAYLSSTEVAEEVNLNNVYAQIPYYSKDNCVSGGDASSCSTDYSVSDVKQILDIWSINYTITNDLIKDNTGYKVRLLTHEELVNNLGYENTISTSTPSSNGITPEWVFDDDYIYCTMSQFNDNDYEIWYIQTDGHIIGFEVYFYFSIRPVITIKKSALN